MSRMRMHVVLLKLYIYIHLYAEEFGINCLHGMTNQGSVCVYVGGAALFCKCSWRVYQYMSYLQVQMTFQCSIENALFITNQGWTAIVSF